MTQTMLSRTWQDDRLDSLPLILETNRWRVPHVPPERSSLLRPPSRARHLIIWVFPIRRSARAERSFRNH
jgi:hypothetical protein